MAFDLSVIFDLTVYGSPAPQGSKRLGLHGRRPVILESNDGKLRPWRASITDAAVRARDGAATFDGPLALAAVFTLARPPSAPKSRNYPDRRPDLSKLLRAVEDALTDAQVYRDDAQLVRIVATKRYVGDPLALASPGVELSLATL